MRIITWNFHCVPVPMGCPVGHIEKVAEYAAALVSEKDPDVFVLNEAFVAHARDAILEALRRVGPWNATPSDAKGRLKVGSGVVVAWRSDRFRMAGKTNKIVYRSCCQWDCLAQKAGIHLPLKTREGAPIHIVATHMQAWEVPLLCNGVRAAQTEALRKMVDELRQRGKIGHGEPVIFAGDFNEEPSRGFEERLGASHVPCEGDCQTHSIGQVDNFYLSGGTSQWRQSTRSRIVSVSSLSNPSDHEPLLMISRDDLL